MDDDPLSRQLVERIMRRRGFAYESVATAEQALEALAGERFDVLVSDVVLSGMNGDALAEKVAVLYPQMPVVLLSGLHRDDLSVVERIELVSFLQKPFLPRDLTGLLSTVLPNADPITTG